MISEKWIQHVILVCLNTLAQALSTETLYPFALWSFLSSLAHYPSLGIPVEWQIQTFIHLVTALAFIDSYSISNWTPHRSHQSISHWRPTEHMSTTFSNVFIFRHWYGEREPQAWKRLMNNLISDRVFGITSALLVYSSISTMSRPNFTKKTTLRQCNVPVKPPKDAIFGLSGLLRFSSSWQWFLVVQGIHLILW